MVCICFVSIISVHTVFNVWPNVFLSSVTETGQAVVRRGKRKIPWVFTRAQKQLVNSRSRRVVMPHNCHAWCTTKEGLLENRKLCWRMITKMRVFFMFPVLFRGTGDLAKSLTKLVYGIRLLIGRVVSERVRHNKRWLTCFNHVSKDDLKLSRRLLPESLCEYMKCTPPNSERSHIHQIIHYPKTVDAFGSLAHCWMFVDERRNKVGVT